MSTAEINWNTIPAEISGETWLAIHEGKARTKEQAVQRARIKTREEDKQFDGFLHTLSLDIEAGEESTVFATLENGDFDPLWQKRCGIGAFKESEGELTNEELTEKLRQSVSPCLRDLLSLVGKSTRSALVKSTAHLGMTRAETNKASLGISSTAAFRTEKRWLAEINKARAEGKSEAEIISMVEQMVGRYFPEILARHEARMEKGVERKESVRVLVREMKKAQLELF